MDKLETKKLLNNGYLILFDLDIGKIQLELESVFNESYLKETICIGKENSKKYKTTLTSIYKQAEFPLHTDGAHKLIPPRWIILEYNGDIKNSTATIIADTMSEQNNIKNEDLFHNEVYFVSGGQHSFLTTIVNHNLHKNSIFRWNKHTMKRLNSRTGIPFEDLKFKKILRIEWEPNQSLIIDNWRMLHGRESIKKSNIERTFYRHNLTPIIHASV